MNRIPPFLRRLLLLAGIVLICAGVGIVAAALTGPSTSLPVLALSAPTKAELLAAERARDAAIDRLERTVDALEARQAVRRPTTGRPDDGSAQ